MSTKSKLVESLMSFISDDNIKRKLQELSPEELKVMEYFIQNVSVGAILAVRELKMLYRVEDPKSIIRRLIDKGLLEQGYGCFSLSRPLREALFQVRNASKV
ncbi:MAG: hypothetical protein JHC33_11570 [Ignisphaera sp.]|nr:hypothetical protein [Ignisphaera sp.]